MDIFMIALLMDENKKLYDENVKLKARLYDLEHPATQSGIDWSLFDITTKGGEKNHGDNELVDGFGTERGHYSL